MRTAPIIALIVVSLLLWAASSPSSTTLGESRLDDIIKALLGVGTAQASTATGTSTGGTLAPVTIPGTTKGTGKTLPPIPGSGNSLFMVPTTNGAKGLFNQ